ncbi:MAG: AbrB/MazE/SpoVT family DNA-binding domain-containing protein [Victivallales bacterium]
MFISTVSSKGQITLPASARAVLGIRKHDKVCIETCKDRITIKSVPSILSFSGSAGKAFSSAEEKKAVKEHVSARHSVKK